MSFNKKDSDQVKKQIHLESQERLSSLGRLASGIAHDFNNLLQTIIGYCEILKLEPNLTKQNKKDLDKILESAHLGASLVEQILDYSRKNISSKSVMNILPFLKEKIKHLARILPENIKLEFHAEPGEYTINVDLVKLQEVLTNLIINAQDALEKGGHIWVELKEVEGPLPFLNQKVKKWIVLKIQDDGKGISKEHLPLIFEPYFTTKEKGKGTGLGLAQIYGIVKDHQGWIDVESEIGKGTTFTLYFPFVKVKDFNPASFGVDLHIPKKNILVVEDQKETLESVSRLLLYLGHIVFPAQNGEEALEIYQKYSHQLDLVITDMTMPGMGGEQLIRKLKSLNPDLKILVLTGYPLKSNWEKDIKPLVDGWIQKPVGLKEMNQKLASL